MRTDSDSLPPPAKRIKLENSDATPVFSASGRALLDDVAQLAEAWRDQRTLRLVTGETTAVVHPTPFPSLTCDGLFEPSLLRRVRQQLGSVTYIEQSSDLFSYLGSPDLADGEAVPPQSPLACLRDALYSPHMVSWLSDVTAIQLDKSSRPDLSSHIYRPGDYLACHDDDIKADLTGRRIAFILYLVEPDWTEADGGSLNLFSLDIAGGPSDRARSIVPAFGRLALFEVSPASFHEVAEVIGDRNRLSISGWFSGPLAHRLIDARFDRTFSPKGADDLMAVFNPHYLDPAVQAELRADFAELGVLALDEFIRPGPYSMWRGKLVAAMNLAPEVGPASVRRHRSCAELEAVEALNIFRTTAFCDFIHRLTGLYPSSHRIRGRRFEGGHYTLLADTARDPNGLDVILTMQPLGDDIPERAGGTMHYVMAADAVGADETDETDLLVIPPSANTLHLCLRDEGCLKYVRRVSQKRAGAWARLDVEAVYMLREDEEDG